MAKTIYFIVMDTTKDREDPYQMRFYEEKALNDISGYLRGVAKTHKTDISSLRLFIAPDRETWKRMWNEFSARVDYSRYGDIV